MDPDQEALVFGQPRNKPDWRWRIVLLVAVGTFAVSISGLVYAVRLYNDRVHEPTIPGIVNLDEEKAKVRRYYESGQYDAELWGLSGKWQDYFASLPVNDDKAAVVFDIDDTLLSSMPEVFANDFAYIPKQFDLWVNASVAPAIPQTVKLFHLLQKRGIKTIAITGRKEFQREATVKNLLGQNITGLDPVILRSKEEEHLSAAAYKSHRRQMLTQSGYRIVGCCGDQISDCSGGYAGYIMKVPNYAYFIA